ncbi:hypothetical protein PPD64_003773 [Providencia stuartii]|nr:MULTISPECIES: hypothetical protein [Providencia]MCR4081772.1 hypothetical protein [Providencia stuartii]
MSILKLMATTASVVSLVYATKYAQQTIAEKMAQTGQYSDAEIQAARLGTILVCADLLGGVLDKLLNTFFKAH